MKTIYKVFIGIAVILILGSAALFDTLKWPGGAAYEPTYTSAAAVDISSLVVGGMTFIDADIDTNNTVNYTTASSELRTGDLLFFEFTESTGNADTITWGTNITGAVDAIPSGKTKVISFIWSGTAYLKLGSQQID